MSIYDNGFEGSKNIRKLSSLTFGIRTVPDGHCPDGHFPEGLFPNGQFPERTFP